MLRAPHAIRFSRLGRLSCPSRWAYLGVLMSLCLAAQVAAQSPLVTEGMVTPKDATTEAEIVVVQMRTADDVPGPPTVVSLAPPRLLLSSQNAAPSSAPQVPYAQNVGPLEAGTWQAYSYAVEWAGQGVSPAFQGFSAPATFQVNRGEVFAQTATVPTGRAFPLAIEGTWSTSCVPEVDRVQVFVAARELVVLMSRTEPTCLPQTDAPARFKTAVSVTALPVGRFEVEVRVPNLNGQGYEVLATSSLNVVPAKAAMVRTLGIEDDLSRGTHQLVVEVETPVTVGGSTCTSWRVVPQSTWLHGRDVYALFETESIDVACDAETRSTLRLPLPELESGLYRVLAQHRDGANQSPTFWAQSAKLVRARALGAVLGDRFRVSVEWRDFSGAQGRGTPVRAARRSGDASESEPSAVFSFFSEDNWELLVKVLDGCALNDHYWVFASASTDVEYTLTVEDTVSDTKATYRNALGTASPAVTDTSALAVCE